MTELELLNALKDFKEVWEKGIETTVGISIRTAVNTTIGLINTICQKANNFQEFKFWMEALEKEVKNKIEEVN